MFLLEKLPREAVQAADEPTGTQPGWRALLSLEKNQYSLSCKVSVEHSFILILGTGIYMLVNRVYFAVSPLDLCVSLSLLLCRC